MQALLNGLAQIVWRAGKDRVVTLRPGIGEGEQVMVMTMLQVLHLTFEPRDRGIDFGFGHHALEPSMRCAYISWRMHVDNDDR